jgi:hypothetical protein
MSPQFLLVRIAHFGRILCLSFLGLFLASCERPAPPIAVVNESVDAPHQPREGQGLSANREQIDRLETDSTKLKQEISKLEAELAKSKEDLVQARRASVPSVNNEQSTQYDTPAVTAKGGTVTFPDGKTRRFTEAFGVRSKSTGLYDTYQRVVGELVFEALDSNGDEYSIPVAGLKSLSFGPQIEIDPGLNKGRAFAITLVTSEGKSEKLRICVPYIEFRWPDSLATTRLSPRDVIDVTLAFDQ